MSLCSFCDADLNEVELRDGRCPFCGGIVAWNEEVTGTLMAPGWLERPDAGPADAIRARPGPAEPPSAVEPPAPPPVAVLPGEYTRPTEAPASVAPERAAVPGPTPTRTSRAAFDQGDCADHCQPGSGPAGIPAARRGRAGGVSPGHVGLVPRAAGFCLPLPRRQMRRRLSPKIGFRRTAARCRRTNPANCSRFGNARSRRTPSGRSARRSRISPTPNLRPRPAW